MCVPASRGRPHAGFDQELSLDLDGELDDSPGSRRPGAPGRGLPDEQRVFVVAAIAATILAGPEHGQRGLEAGHHCGALAHGIDDRMLHASMVSSIFGRWS